MYSWNLPLTEYALKIAVLQLSYKSGDQTFSSVNGETKPNACVKQEK